jgi:hypothetical protein
MGQYQVDGLLERESSQRFFRKYIFSDATGGIEGYVYPHIVDSHSYFDQEGNLIYSGRVTWEVAGVHKKLVRQGVRLGAGPGIWIAAGGDTD